MIILMKGYGLENGFLCVFPFANYLWLILTGFMTLEYFQVDDYCQYGKELYFPTALI